LGAVAVEGAAEGVVAWGEGAAATAESSGGMFGFLSEIDLGGGFKLKLSTDMFRQIMHTPSITEAVHERCEELCNACNALAVTPGAIYVYQVSTNPSNIRARGRVKPGNFKAVVDDAAHSTLLKALASVGSDPKPVVADGSSAAEGPPALARIPQIGEAGGAEVGAAEAGGADLAEVAVIALA